VNGAAVSSWRAVVDAFVQALTLDPDTGAPYAAEAKPPKDVEVAEEELTSLRLTASKFTFAVFFFRTTPSFCFV
jgi:hypothetical protein